MGTLSNLLLWTDAISTVSPRVKEFIRHIFRKGREIMKIHIIQYVSEEVKKHYQVFLDASWLNCLFFLILMWSRHQYVVTIFFRAELKGWKIAAAVLSRLTLEQTTDQLCIWRVTINRIQEQGLVTILPNTGYLAKLLAVHLSIFIGTLYINWGQEIGLFFFSRSGHLRIMKM